jgi:hypothetical protein
MTNSRDSMYWAIFVLAPIWYSREWQDCEPMVDTSYIKIGTIHVTMLSGIKIGLSRAVGSWIEIGDYLEKLLGAEYIFLDAEANDKFCFYDHNDLSQSKKCFWIINSVDKFDKSIQDTLYQWEWFHQTHIKCLLSGELPDKVPQHELLSELRNDIVLLHQKLKAQSKRFLAIQKEARELRDGVSYLLLYIRNHLVLTLTPAFRCKQPDQCKRVRPRSQEFRTSRRDRQAPYFSHNLLSPIGIHHSESTPIPLFSSAAKSNSLSGL